MQEKTTEKRYRRNELLNKRQLFDRGWTESIIKKVIRKQPIVIRGKFRNSVQKCWPVTYIEQRENSAKFQELKALAAERSAKGLAAAKTKADNNLILFTARVDEVEVPRLELDKIYAESEDSRMRFYEWRSIMLDRDFDDVQFSPDADTLDRWAVNYIRHELTDYDEILNELKGKVGSGPIYGTVHNLVLDKIAAVYPELADECDRQKIKVA